jgi:hypothetical protein
MKGPDKRTILARLPVPVFPLRLATTKDGLRKSFPAFLEYNIEAVNESIND